MRNVFFITVILASSLSFAAPGIGHFEQQQILPRQVAEMTGLQQQDSRYTRALESCAKNDAAANNEKGVIQNYQEVVQYLNSDEYKTATPANQERDLVMIRISIKMLCSVEINALGIDP